MEHRPVRIDASRVVQDLPGEIASRGTHAYARIFVQGEKTLDQLGDRLPLILDAGETTGNLASTIVKLDGDDWAVMRQGLITEDQIRTALEDETEE